MKAFTWALGLLPVVCALVGVPAFAADDREALWLPQQSELLDKVQALRRDSTSNFRRELGRIRAVNPSGPTVVIDGLRYRFARDATVSIGGTYGAPTLLEPGLIVEFYARKSDDDARIIHALAELEKAAGYAPH